MGGEVDKLRQAGFTETEISDWGSEKSGELSAAGFTQPEIDSYLGIKPIDVAGANKNLAKRVAAGTDKMEMAKKAAKQIGQIAVDNATVYGPIEAALNVTTGAVAGFPAYLAGGVKELGARALGLSDDDPKEVATRWAEAVTYTPRTDAGQRLTDFATLPLHKLVELSESAGKTVAEKTESPTAAAITEATIQMLPAFLIPAFGKALKGKTPTNSDMYVAAKNLAPDQPHPVVTELQDKVQTAYEKSGIDPETMKNQAFEDVTVLQDLASDNHDVPRSMAAPDVESRLSVRVEGETDPLYSRAVDSVEKLGRASVSTIRREFGIDGDRAERLIGQMAKDGIVADKLVNGSRSVIPKEEPAGSPPVTPDVTAPAPNAEQAVLDRVSVGESTSQSITVDEVYTAVKDDLYPIAKIEEKLTGGASLETAESPYALARLTRGSAGKATQFLDHNTFDFNTYKNTGEGLKQILEPVKDDIDGFRAYAVAKRSAELEAKGIKTGVPQAEAAQVIAAGGKYAEPFKKLQDYQNALVKYLKDSGVVSDEAYQTMLDANQNYVPFHRLFSEEKGGIGKGFNVSNPIKSIKGSERIIVDPLESIIKNTYLYTALAERNAVGAAFGKLVEGNKALAEDLGVSRVKQTIKPVEVSEKEVQKFMDEHGIEGDAAAFNIFRPNAMRPAPNQIRYFENGKPVTLEVPEGVADAFNATDQQTAGMLVKILSVPAKTLRAGSVLSPDFMARNVIRDQLTAFMFSKNGYIPVWDMMSGMYSFATKDMAFQDWLKSGGANSTLVSMDRQYLQQHLVDLNKSTGLMTRAINVAKTPLEVLRIVSEFTENATRLGDFKKAKATDKASAQEAGFNAREVTLDFGRIGAQTRGLNMIASFMNAGLEGLDRTTRAFKDAPIGTTAKVAAGITLPSVLLWMANHDDPRYKEIPQWEKDLFWIAMTKDHIYRIPKPFEVGVIFGSVPERMMDKFAADNPEAFKNFGDTLLQAFGVNVFPTFAMPPLEQVTNHSFFTGNPLIPSRMEGILPEYQYNEYTSELSKKIGATIGSFPGMKNSSLASPIVVDNYIRGWTGSVGGYVRDLLDKGLREAGVLPDPPQPIATLADIPVVKAFVVRYPSASAQSVQDFYDAYSERKTVYDTFQYLVSNGDPDASIKEAELAPEAFAQMDGINASIAELNSNIRMIYKNPDISPSDQRQLIDTMYGQMIELAKVGNETMNDVDKVLGK